MQLVFLNERALKVDDYALTLKGDDFEIVLDTLVPQVPSTFM